MVAPIIAGKAAQSAGERARNALTGDIYTRGWTTVSGTGKNKRVVHHELRVNPVSVGLGAIAAGVTAVGLGVGLWLVQKKVVRSDSKSFVRIVDYHPSETTTTTVVDEEAYYYRDKDTGRMIYVPAVTHEETTITKLRYWIVKNSVGVPMWRKVGLDAFSFKDHALTQRERAWNYTGVDVMKSQTFDWGTRSWVRFTTDSKSGYGLGDREGFLS